MKYLLDTNILIYMLKKPTPALIKRFKSVASPAILIPAIVRSELEYGFCKSGDYERSRFKFEPFLRLFATQPFTERAAKEYGRIAADLQKTNQLIGNMDMLIAATAKAEGMTLVTHNTKEFERIPGLLIEDWVEG